MNPGVNPTLSPKAGDKGGAPRLFASWIHRITRTCLNRIVIQRINSYHFRIMGSSEKTISFRAIADKIAELDALAAAQDRSRSYLINEAISNYIELHAYQDALVRQGLAEMRKGRVVSHDEVVKRLKKTGRASQ